MEEVFTIYDRNHDPFLEVRRKPRSKTGKHTIYPDNACNLRLVNRYCYFNNAAEIMADFIHAHGYEFRRIFRLDLALDFERFDSGDYPEKVLRRIVSHKYAKIYQANRTIRGTEKWDACRDNYICWGNTKSMVVTAFYNKSKELEDSGWRKPWIVQAWFEAGLIDNPVTRTRKSQDGAEYTPEIWRLEFRLSSSARKYVRLEGDEGDTFVEHTLDTYLTRERLWIPFSQLIQHYFMFRKYKRGKRKYDCPPKILFNLEDTPRTYKLVNTANNAYSLVRPARNVATLRRIATECATLESKTAAETLIRYFERTAMSDFKYQGMSDKLLQLLAAIGADNISIEDLKKDMPMLF